MINTLTIPSYPARPVNRGPVHLRPLPHGEWLMSAKVNGWRALVHRPSGSMWNRHGEPLTIASSFTMALNILAHMNHLPDWLDCEAFDRRHPYGKGALVVLDYVPESGEPSALARYHTLAKLLPVLNVRQMAAPNSVTLIGQTGVNAKSTEQIRAHWHELQAINGLWKCEYYEGLVFKLDSAPYPKQLASPDATSPSWQKSRWAY